MKTASQPLVSVVTPVYNEAQHLAECIESVRGQTYGNWEYTIVDNCSTDNSLEIARHFAGMDPRIRVCQNSEFLRAIPNHNRALQQISSDSRYCKVVLGDDWIFPECLERMVAVAEAHPSAGIVGAYALEGRDVTWTGLPYSNGLFPGREVCRQHLLEDLYIFGTATSVLYRADLVRGSIPFFNEDNIHSDTEACFALLKSSDFGFVHQVLTFTRLRAGSLNTVADDMQTHYAARLHLLEAYGPDYLTQEELQSCLDRHLGFYYRFLGKSLMLRRDKKFWDYHRSRLAKAADGYSSVRVAKGALAELLDAALNPKQSTEKVLRRCFHSSV